MDAGSIPAASTNKREAQDDMTAESKRVYEWQKAHPEKVRQYRRRHRRRHKAELRAWHHAYYVRNKLKVINNRRRGYWAEQLDKRLKEAV